MRPDFNKRYTMIAVYCTLVLLACIFCVFVIVNFGAVIALLLELVAVLSPILIGAIIAYMLVPCVSLFERRVYNKLDRRKKYRTKRVLSVVTTFVLVIGFLLLLVLRIIPSVLRGYADLQDMSRLYLETVKGWLFGISLGEEHMLNGYFETLIEYFVGLLDEVYGVFMRFSPDITSLAKTLVSILSNVVLGVILSIYFIFSKEKMQAQFKKMARAFLSDRRFFSLLRNAEITSDKFGGFMKGQVADALIIGTLSYICLSIIGVPYYPLVSVLVGISAFIPLVGVLVGTVIGAVIIFLADPLDTLWFILFMIVLNFVNKYMIRPKIVRTNADASAVFMLTAIIVMTGLVGFWGLILGVPIFAVVYAYIHSFVNKRLTKRGLSTDAYEYYATDAGKELYREGEIKKARLKRLRGETAVAEDLTPPAARPVSEEKAEELAESETLKS